MEIEISFTLQPLYLWEMNFRHKLNGNLGGTEKPLLTPWWRDKSLTLPEVGVIVLSQISRLVGLSIHVMKWKFGWVIFQTPPPNWNPPFNGPSGQGTSLIHGFQSTVQTCVMKTLLFTHFLGFWEGSKREKWHSNWPSKILCNTVVTFWA
jgi:hypothetical protein